MEHLTGVGLLLLQIGVILAVARVMGVIFQRLGQPSVVAEIVAGLTLGPSLLGRVWPAGMEGLFPRSSLGTLDVIAQVGLILFMFVVGMEFDPGLIRSKARLAAITAISSIALPFALGLGLGFTLHAELAPEGIALLPFSLFLGAATCVTAFPVLARILSEHGMTRTELGSLVMTCAAANDAAAWCVLAFVIAVVQSDGGSAALLTTGLTLLYVAVMLGGVRPLTRRLLRYYQAREGIARPGLTLLVLLLFASAFATHLIGIHALFGAFVFGAVLPRERRVLHALTLRVEDLVIVLFLPVFFAVTGLRTEMGMLDSPERWSAALLVIGVATAGKLIGAGLPPLLGGMSPRQSATIGVLMNTRGLMELIILEIGRQLGVLSPLLFTMFVLMAVATTLMTSPLLHRLYPRAMVLEALPGAASRAPVATPAFSLLTCVASPASVHGLALLTAALGRGRDARSYALTLLSMRDAASLLPESAAALPEGEEPASQLAQIAGAQGVTVEALSMSSADLARDIVEVAALKKADMLLAGAHRPMFGHALLGGPLLEIAAEYEGDLLMLLDRGLERVERVLAVRDGPHRAAVERVVARLKSRPGLQITWLEGAELEDLAASVARREAEVDLIVLGINPARGLAMQMLDLRAVPLLEETRRSVLVVHGAAA